MHHTPFLIVLSLFVACDPKADTATEAATTVTDADADGYEVGEDCDDANNAIHPAADEVCDGIDNNCDGIVDEDAADLASFYADGDGDGYGDALVMVTACEAPDGHVTDATDCDDANADASPASTEICDGVDNDCDAATSEDGMAHFVSEDGVWSDWGSRLSGDVNVESAGTLHVCAGTWDVNLDLADGVSLIGAGMDETILDGGLRGSVIEALGDLHIEGVTVQNGDGDVQVNDYLYAGGGLGCDVSGASLTVTDARFTGNTGYSGGAIASTECDLELDGVELVENAGGFGSALSTHRAAVIIRDTLVADNVTDTTSSFYINACDIEIDGSTFEDNDAAYAAALFLNDAATASISDSTFHRNTSNTGAITLSSRFSGTVEVSDSDFGAEDGIDDNTSADLTFYGSGDDYNYGAKASFSCDDEGCE